MAVHRQLNNVFSKTANADLSSSQYRILYVVNDADVDVLANDGTHPIGVLLNKPAAAGRAARVAGPGCICKVEAGAVIDEGDRIVAVAGGRGSAAPAGTNVWTAGIAMTAASGSGVIFEMMVHPLRGVQG